MANVLLLPGFGSKYTSALIAAAGTGADVLDCSRCATLAFQTSSNTGNATTITIEQSFDGTNFATLTTFSGTAGTFKALPITSGPFGLVRAKANGSTGGVTVTALGFELPVVN